MNVILLKGGTPGFTGNKIILKNGVYIFEGFPSDNI